MKSSPFAHLDVIPTRYYCPVLWKKDVKQIVHAAFVHILKANRNIHIHYVENSSMNIQLNASFCAPEDRSYMGLEQREGE